MEARFQELQQTNLGRKGLSWNAPKASHKSLPKMMMHKLIALEAPRSPSGANMSFCVLSGSAARREQGQGEVDGSWQSHREGKHFNSFNYEPLRNSSSVSS